MPDAAPPVTIPDAISDTILRWYAENARALPWRNAPAADLPNDDRNWPYRVWLSEVMLQQTTVVAATPYFRAFTDRWPSVNALAAADDADVMQAWAGLGYYARARNLLACARAVVRDHAGRFPSDEDELRKLPGVGSYTAAAIAAFAFGKRAVVVDGNIERVVARLFAIATPLPAAKTVIGQRMDALTPEARAGDFAQGLMDLARSVCTPKSPKCLICPIAGTCAGRGNPMAYPVKAKKAVKPERTGTAYWIERNGHVWLIRRPEKGLLGGMRALPSDGWDEKNPPRNGEGELAFDCSQQSKTVPGAQFRQLRAKTRGWGGRSGSEAPDPHNGPSTTSWSPSPFRGGSELGTVTHVFTHFRLTLALVPLDAEKGCALHPGGEWWPKAELDNAGLPSLFVKAARIVTSKDD